ncbi:MAG: SPOR domain-containing protein [Deltaproteobacteria bacterium]|nr:MAG: SPOR domain-containing protein [Deltaproteobacteria bacterium]
MDEIDPVYSRAEPMSDYKKDLEDYFCRFTFGQFITLVLFEIVTLFFVFYLGAKYGSDLVGNADVARKEPQVEDSLLPQGKKSVDEIVGDKGGSYTYPEVLSGNSRAIRIKPSGVSSADLEKQAYRRQGGQNPEPDQAPIQVPSSRGTVEEAVKEEPARPVIKEIPEKTFPKTEPKAEVKIGSKTTVKTPGQLTAEEIERESQKIPQNVAPEETADTEAQLPVAVAKPAGVEKQIIPSGKFSIQMGSYPTHEEAQAALKVWKKKGYSAFVKEADIPGKGLWYRVRLGSFSNKDQAKVFLDKIKKKEKKTGIVVSNKG